MVKTKALYISNYKDNTTTVGYRFLNFIKYSKDFLDIEVLDIPTTKNRFSFFRKVFNKLFIYPDIYFFNLYTNKQELKKKFEYNKYDLVIIEIQPFSFLSLVTFIKRVQPGIHVMVDMNDPLTANVSYLNDGILHRKFISWYERKHLINVDTLIVLNKEIKNYYCQKYCFLKNIVVLEQGTNPSPYRSFEPFTNNKVELIYGGMFYSKVREPFCLYEAINDYDGEIRLSIYGSFKKKFLPPASQKFYYGGLIEKKILEERIAKTDIVIFFDNFFGLQIPGKILEILESDKPILFIYENNKSPTLRYTKDYDGVYLAKNNSEEILKQLMNIMSVKKNKYKRDLTRYYWQNLIKDLFLINENLLNHLVSHDQ